MTTAELAKAYEPKDVEPRWYDFWLQNAVFAAHDEPEGKRPVYSLPMPPPNVTGSLHMGHALNNTLQDILCRFERMRGRDVLWQPGTDHAGIATQMVVERQLAAAGANQGRKELGREAFVAKVWEWRAQSGGTIVRQMRDVAPKEDDDGRRAARAGARRRFHRHHQS